MSGEGDTMSGYINCGCRDCFELTIGEPGDFCDECIEAGCEPDHECCVEHLEDEDEDDMDVEPIVETLAPYCNACSVAFGSYCSAECRKLAGDDYPC